MTTDALEHHVNCRICPAQCGIVVTTAGSEVLNVRGDADHPMSEGYTCVKGRMLGLAHHDPRRIDHAGLGRLPERTEQPLSVVLDDLGTRLRDIVERFGPDAVGVYYGTHAFQESGGAAIPKLVAALGSRSFYSIVTVDGIAKYVAGLKISGGRHTLAPKVDYAHASLVLAFGANPIVSHTQGTANPLVKLRRVASRGELWVVDPRRTEGAKLATRHLQIRAGTDAFLAAFLVREILRSGADEEFLRDHATGVETLRRAVQTHTLDVTARRTGLSESDLVALVDALRAAGRIAVTSGTGIRMGPHPTVTEWLLFALSIVTGSMDREGGTMLVGRGLALAPPGAVAEAPGPPSRPELRTWAGHRPCAALADEIETGSLKALLSFGGNPLGAIPGSARIGRALASLDVFAVHDFVPTPSTDLATHVLPGTSQFEHSALVSAITPDGRPFVQYSPTIFSPRADRRPVWWYVNEIANRLGRPIYEQPVMESEVHRPPGWVADIDAVRSAPGSMLVGDPLRFGEFTDDLPDGQWNLAPTDLVAELESLATTPVSPVLVLIPHRQVRHSNWTLTELTGPSGKRDQPELLIHPDDAAREGIVDGAAVVARTAHGEVTAHAHVTTDIGRGAVSIPHGHRTVDVNVLTSTADGVDLASGMPMQGGVPVAVAPLS